MAAGSIADFDIEAWWPAIKRIAIRRAQRWDIEADDLAQSTALLVLQRIRRGQEFWGWRTLTLCVLEAIRRIQSPEARSGRSTRMEWDAIPPKAGGRVLELCHLPTEVEPVEDPDEENTRHRIEWETMGLRERQTRIMESRRALLCSM